MTDDIASRTPLKPRYTCPKCGGAGVQELVIVYEDMNTRTISDAEPRAPMDIYSARFWCQDCQTHINRPEETRND